MGPTILTVKQRRLALITALMGSVLPVVVVTVADRHDARPTFLVGAALAALAPVGSILSPPHHRWIRWPFAFAGLPGLTLMQAHTGGVSSPYAILLVMGMIWFGLMASDRELIAGMAVTVGCCFLPMLLIGAPAYPVQPAHALALALVNCSVLLGLAFSTRETARLTTRLRHEATHDRLTGLLNRRGWDDALERRSTRQGPSDIVVLVDLDQLKQVNDESGHDRGDELLRTVAGRLRSTFDGNGDETVARLGGDEFVMLVPGATTAEVVRMLDQVRAAAGPAERFSAGVAVIAPSEGSGDAMRRADLALYEAKTTGRGRTCVAGAPVGDAMPLSPIDVR